jgi:hypothetical protein
MPPRPKPDPLVFKCSTHGRIVRAGTEPGRLEHVSEGIDRNCQCERYTRIQQDEVSREAVLAELAAMGEDGNL